MKNITINSKEAKMICGGITLNITGTNQQKNISKKKIILKKIYKHYTSQSNSYMFIKCLK